MRQLFILGHILILPLFGYSQNCGLDASLPINPNSLHSYNLEISEVFNDDLSAPDQGLCGIEILFRHNYSENLEMWLEAPSGQTIQLMGPNTDDQLAFTFFATWNISFVPCLETAEPDAGHSAQWDNNQINNFVNGALYEGSYYPFLGCLEDFNMGTANGTWTINIANNPSTYEGVILDFRLIFCDPRGQECCFADAGTLPDTLDLVTCVGDQSLAFDFDPIFSDEAPDSLEYGYTYAIGEDGILLEYDSILDLTTFPVGNFQICGLSYNREEVDSFPQVDGVITLDSIRNSLNSFEPFFCGVLTDSCIDIQILPPPASSTLIDTICAGETYILGDSSLTETGNYAVILPSFANCDSTVNLDLTVLEIPVIDLVEVICEGDTFSVGTSSYTDSGIYADTLNNFFGCDSIVNLDLTVLAPIAVTLTETICQDDSFMVGDSLINTPGTHIITLASSQNCDSIITLNLNIIDPQATIDGLDLLSCFQPEITLTTTSSTPVGMLDFQWTNLDGDNLGMANTITINTPGSYILEATQLMNGTTCSDLDTIIITADFIPPVADAGAISALTCTINQLQLGGPGTTQNDTVIYAWVTDVGNFISDTDILNPIIDAAGTYTLTVTDTINGCTATDLINITIDTLPPTAEAGPDQIINCSNAPVALGDSGPPIPNLEYFWTGPNCIQSDETSNNIIVNCPGVYYLRVTNPDNGCTAIDSVNVNLDDTTPIADAGIPDTIYCDNLPLELDGSGTTGENLSFQWSGPGLESGVNSPNSFINQPGTYQLIATNTASNCSDTATVEIAIDTLHPIIDLVAMDSLTCDILFLELGGPNTSSGPNFMYNWSSPEGNFLGPMDEATAFINAGGVYNLNVTNTINGCNTIALATIFSDTIPPFVNAGLDQEITCGSEAVLLDGSSSNAGPFISYEWQGDCILSPIDDDSIFVDCPGVYVLTSTNLQSGCISTDTVEVSLNQQAPFATLPDSVFISCETGTAFLDASGSVNGNLIWLFEETATSLSGLNPEVNQIGNYSLIVDNPGLNCSDTASVVVALDCQPSVVIASPGTITCGDPSVILDASASSAGPQYSYQWTAEDLTCILDGADSPTPEVRCAGDYQLVVTNEIVGTSDSLIVTVLIDNAPPTAIAGLPDTLDCAEATITLDGSNSIGTHPISYLWTNFNGDTISMGVFAEVNSPDIYILEITDEVNGCVDVDAVSISQNIQIPEISFGNNLIPCEADTSLLEAFVDQGGDYTYSWTGPSILSPANELAIEIGMEGWYYLSILNNENTCNTQDSIEVIRQSCGPCLLSTIPDSLTCNVLAVTLEATLCEDCIGCDIEWTTDNGVIDSQNGLTAEVSEPGIYTLTVTDLEGFSTIENIVVIENSIAPLSDAGPDQDLTCVDTFLTLGGPNSSTGANFSYSWTSSNGPIIPPANEATLQVNEEGIYTLNVINNETGCSNSDIVEVGRNVIAPTANAGLSQNLTCEVSLLTLDASASTLGQNIAYAWSSTDNSCIEDGANSINPFVSCSGVYVLTVTDTINGCFDTASVLVNQLEAGPVIPAIPDTVLTCSVSDIELVAALPTTDGLNFRWCRLDEDNTPILPCTENSLSLMVDEAGSYLFEVSEAISGCVSAEIVNVVENIEAPSADAGPPNAILNCNIENLTLMGTAGPDLNVLDIQWSSLGGAPIENDTTLSPSISQVDTYVLTVTNRENQCSTTDEIQIIEDLNAPDVDAGASQTLSCNQQSLTLNATAFTSSGNMEIQWTTNTGNIFMDADSLNAIIDQSGMYYLSINDPDNNCSSIDSVLIDEDFNAPTIQVDLSGNGQINCQQDIVILDAGGTVISNNATPEFNWSINPIGNISGGNATSAIIEVDAVGFYQLIVTDPINGCQDTSIVQIGGDFNEPTVVIAFAPDLACNQPSVTLNASASDQDSFLVNFWTAPDGSILPDSSLMPTISEAGEYTLSITNTINGCESSASVLVGSNFVNPNAQIETPDLLDCTVTATTLDGSNSSGDGNLTFTWSTNNGNIASGQNNAIASADTAGFYTLLVTDNENGCIDSDSVEVIEIASRIETLVYSVTSPDCIGDLNGTVTIESVSGGTPPYSYSLNTDFFTTNPVFQFLSAGTYNLIAQDASGCEYETTVIVPEVEQIAIDLGIDINLSLGDSTLLQALVNIPDYESLSWQPNDQFECPECPEQWIRPMETSTYAVIVRDSNGCQATDWITVQVSKPRSVYVPSAFSPNGDGINDILTIFAAENVKEIRTFMIFDRWGNQVFGQEAFQANDPKHGWDGNFEGQPMNAAVFAFYAEVEFVDGWIEMIKGDITLMR